MNKYLILICLLLTFSAFADDAKIKSEISSQKETVNDKSSFDQHYIDFLKEVNTQQQLKYENAVSNYNSYINWISAFAGLASLLLLLFGFLSFIEYRKIKALKAKANKVVGEFEKTIADKNEELKKFIISNTVNRINKSSVDVLLSLANTTWQINT